MSVVKLLKDHPRGKAGAVVSVRFHEANDLVRDGIAVRPGAGVAPPPAPTPGELAALARVKELEAARVADGAKVAALEARVKEMGDALKKAAGEQTKK